MLRISYIKNGGKMKKSELVEWFQLTYPDLVSRMKKCNHHLDSSNLNLYHLEGDVWCHTMMALNQVHEISSRLVKIAALLHDIGKPFTREVTDKGRVRFLGHESMGAFLSLEILKEPFLNLSASEQVLVFKLISLHTESYKLTTNQMEELLTNEYLLSNMLRQLSQADKTGRFTNKEDVELFFNYKSSSVKLKSNKELIMLVGLPASGKSTFASELQKQGYTVISRDSIIESMYPDDDYITAYSKADRGQVNNELSKLLTKNRNTEKLVIDMTNLTKKNRSKILKQFPDHCKKAEVFIPDLRTLFERNKDRVGKHISEEVIFNMIKSFYLPTHAEFDHIHWNL